MKAVVYDKKNVPTALTIREIEKPIPDDDEALVKIHAVSVNAADYRSMKMGIIPKRKIFGSDIAGRVEAVGKNVTQFTVGDEVFGDISAVGFGGFAEYAAVSETVLALKPLGVAFDTAAAIPMSAVTALQALRDRGHIQPGQKVLICGAGGGVGTFSVQLAKYFGAEVTAVCGTDNVKIVESLGADYVINYKENDFTQSGRLYDLILAINGNYPLFTYKRLLSAGGICVMVGGSLPQVFKFILFGSFLSMGNKKMRTLAAKQNIMDLNFIMRLVAGGQMRPVIDRRYPLHLTSEAVQYLSGGHALGKVIIEVV